jgi:cytochrome b
MNSLVKVWDLPTRLFHWALVLSISASAISVLVFEHMVWHARFGYLIASLLLFRLVWGLVGGYWSRFVNFKPSFSDSLTYLRHPANWTRAGHNPMGSWSVIVMLSLIFLQLMTGLGSDDDAGFSGPLTPHISSAWVSLATRYHADVGQWLLLFWVCLHMAAVAYQTVMKKTPLVKAMLSGYRVMAHTNPSSADSGRHRWLAVLLFSICSAITCVCLQLLDTQG